MRLLLVVSALGEVHAVHAEHWPTSNDALSEQLLRAQRTIREGYAAQHHTAGAGLALQPTGGRLAAAASSWAKQVLRGVPLPAGLEPVLQRLRAHMATVHNFSAAKLPPGVRRLPVFYPFCGVDLGHALALFPDSPSHVMLAAIPLGDPLCFLIAKCREHTCAHTSLPGPTRGLRVY